MPESSVNDPKTRKGGTRATEGGERAEMGERAQLRDELERIGTYKRSIDAAGLASCETLLGCQRVATRLGTLGSSTSPELVAHQALQDAIASVRSNDLPIAQAVLAVTPAFEHKTVEQRKETLNNQHHISPDAYKHRRPSVVDAIVDFLMKPEPSRAPQTATTYQQALGDIHCVVDDTVQFLYHCLGYLFICDVAGAALPPPHERELEFYRGLLARDYVSLIISSGYCFDAADYSQRERILTDLPAELCERLAFASRTILDHFPYDAERREDICSRCLEPLTDNLPQQRWRDGLTNLEMLVLGSNFTFTADEDHARIRAVIADCYTLWATARLWIPLKTNEITMQESVIGTVAAFYDIDPAAIIEALKPDLGDGRLDHGMEQYFAKARGESKIAVPSPHDILASTRIM